MHYTKRLTMNKQAPEIFQLPLASLDMSGLPQQADPGV
jgi:hypothetical protein